MTNSCRPSRTGATAWLIESESEFDEAEWVVNDVLTNHQQGLRWDQQMIMCRTSYSARPVEAELIRRKIPYRFIGGVGLLQMGRTPRICCRFCGSSSIIKMNWPGCVI